MLKVTSNTLTLEIGQMTYSVHQHWDPLKVCIVGRSYSPEFYHFIKNDRVRTVMERIARETEEDFQKLITLLESFEIEVVRPSISDNFEDYIQDGKILPPPMVPRDYSLMLGENFHLLSRNLIDLLEKKWDQIRGDDWPVHPPKSFDEVDLLSENILIELKNMDIIGSNNRWKKSKIEQFTWNPIVEKVKTAGNNIHFDTSKHLAGLNGAMYTRIGKDIYVGTHEYGEDTTEKINWLNKNVQEYRWHSVNSGGHSDGTFCAVVPGLIISLYDIPTYAETFPGWEVVYLPGQSWQAVKSFLDLKEKNAGKWWVPGEELNDDFTSFVEEWLGHWVGYVEETVFDVNMLVIDKHNVVCNNYNEQVFSAFARHGITPHVINFRHRWFWDGGLHCITSDVHREGVQKDYFPERSLT